MPQVASAGDAALQIAFTAAAATSLSLDMSKAEPMGHMALFSNVQLSTWIKKFLKTSCLGLQQQLAALLGHTAPRSLWSTPTMQRTLSSSPSVRFTSSLGKSFCVDLAYFVDFSNCSQRAFYCFPDIRRQADYSTHLLTYTFMNVGGTAAFTAKT